MEQQKHWLPAATFEVPAALQPIHLVFPVQVPPGPELLVTAVKHRYLDLVEALVASGADLQASTTVRGIRAVVFALVYKKLSRFVVALQEGTALYVACKKGFADVAMVLIDRNASIEANDHVGTARAHKAAQSHMQICIYVLALPARRLRI